MTDQIIPLDLLRAELKAAMAEQLVNLMDRFVSKADFHAHEQSDERHFREINQKLDVLLTEKDQRDGADELESKHTSSVGLWLMVLATLAAGVFGAVATIAAYAIWH